MTKNIVLAQGNGGEENAELISKIFYKHFKNEILAKSEDAAIIDGGRLAFTTDSFTVSPIFFDGGDIGKLSICGTCNDLAMMGAKPTYMTCAVIVEEGFSVEELEKIVRSMKKELEINGAMIVCGDTKVVPRGSVDKIFINTTGVGVVQKSGISSNSVSEEDVIIVSNEIGKHGATIFANREGMEFSSNLQSDCTSLWPLVEKLLSEGIAITAMRDATRGGVAAVLNEWAKQSKVCIEVNEEAIPVSDDVRGICEILGFEAYNLANEGTFVLAVKRSDAERAVDVLKTFEEGVKASIIASVTHQYDGRVLLLSPWGSKRFMDLPTGELLPRIC
ncbi:MULTISPECIES: hydrogenase expression/formation protein HypE [unclassified Sulfuricurvum]|uniref:hydrogenase expression/formation protein HypE n=1 Tax=unclassified Sulfuricurvum TaxID=2632390 RepID=UPI0002997E8D|nr:MULTISPECIES: hydrogenase expression/formation protein HypE [unclassified Sulfuricurvum]AFV98212.1 hydrogenase expression/formation protein HypE [Candidatus Sulfuricurvum sp. RIFRC-1]HBM34742.1 hydrogenase expression/formation protein HypE [Sulfuricurvum sp.]